MSTNHLAAPERAEWAQAEIVKLTVEINAIAADLNAKKLRRRQLQNIRNRAEKTARPKLEEVAKMKAVFNRTRQQRHVSEKQQIAAQELLVLRKCA